MNPFDKPIEQLLESDIRGLLESGFSERRYIDYKRTLPDIKRDEAKCNFLDDVSAFANAGGGCIVYGVAEKEGVPTHVSGVGERNFDEVKRQLEEIVRAHIRPRLSPPISLQEVKAGDGHVLVAHIRRSWRAPHMVCFPPESNRFIVRTVAGNHRMDVEDLRAAFLSGAGVEGQVREFRAQRLSRIVSGETPYPLVDAPTLALHVVPVSAFDRAAGLAPEQFRQFEDDFFKIHFGRAGSRYNLDGLVFAHGADEAARYGYAQLFRTGAIEFLDRTLVQAENGSTGLYIFHVEEYSIRWVEVGLDVLSRLHIDPPAFVMVSLLGVRGCRLRIGNRDRTVYDTQKRLVDRDDLLIDPVLVESFDQPPEAIVHSAMDHVWQAAGWPRSLNFTEDHKWNPPRS